MLPSPTTFRLLVDFPSRDPKSLSEEMGKWLGRTLLLQMVLYLFLVLQNSGKEREVGCRSFITSGRTLKSTHHVHDWPQSLTAFKLFINCMTVLLLYQWTDINFEGIWESNCSMINLHIVSTVLLSRLLRASCYC